MIREAIIQLAARQDLSYDTAAAVMDEIMSGQASQIQMASFLTALAIKGETIDEITACAAGMRAHCVRLLHDVDALEIVGTGGDGANSFNISTTSAFVIAAGGVPVAKHGNRAASSKCGAADVLESLGVDITLAPGRTELLFPVRTELPYLHEVCGPSTQRAGHPYGIQYSGPPVQPGRRQPGTDGRI